MNNFLSYLAIILSFTISGLPWARLAKKLTTIEYISLGFVLGSGMTTFLWFILYRLGLSLDLNSFALAILASYLFGLLVTKTNNFSLVSIYTNTFKYKNIITSAIIAICISVVIISAYYPVTAWDALTLYDFRGIVIAQTHSLSGIEISSYYLSYPLMTSLMHALTYMLGGSNPNFLYGIFYLSLIAIIYGRTLFLTNAKHALIASLLTASTPLLFEHATISYTNLPYALFLVSAILYTPSSIFLAGLMVGLSTWTRTAEPFWVVGLVYMLYQGFINKNIKPTTLGLISFITIKLSWTKYLAAAYQRHNFVKGSSNIISLDTISVIYSNLPKIMHYVYEFIIYPHLGVFAILIVGLLITLQRRTKNQNTYLPLFAVIIAMISMIIIGTAVFSTYYKSWYSIGGSATRMVIFLIPLLIVSGVQLMYQKAHDAKH